MVKSQIVFSMSMRLEKKASITFTTETESDMQRILTWTNLNKKSWKI